MLSNETYQILFNLYVMGFGLFGIFLFFIRIINGIEWYSKNFRGYIPYFVFRYGLFGFSIYKILNNYDHTFWMLFYLITLTISSIMLINFNVILLSEFMGIVFFKKFQENTNIYIIFDKFIDLIRNKYRK
jgi:hypothetical protein